MPLTPTAHDPNREAELKRKQEDPASFGVSVRDNPNGKDRKTETQRQRERELKG